MGYESNVARATDLDVWQNLLLNIFAQGAMALRLGLIVRLPHCPPVHLHVRRHRHREESILGLKTITGGQKEKRFLGETAEEVMLPDLRNSKLLTPHRDIHHGVTQHRVVAEGKGKGLRGYG